MNTSGYLLPNRRGRLIWLVVAIGCALVWEFNHLAPGWIERWLDARDLETGTTLLIAFNVVDALFFLVVCIALAHTGRLVLTYKRWPPPGFPVPFRIKVSTGKGASVVGIAFFIGAGLALLSVAFHGYLVWLSVGI